jgi:hypothetical protein
MYIMLRQLCLNTPKKKKKKIFQHHTFISSEIKSEEKVCPSVRAQEDLQADCHPGDQIFTHADLYTLICSVSEPSLA